MIWPKSYQRTRLRDYYVGFALVFPVGLILLFAAVRVLLHTTLGILILAWLLTSAGMVVVGAPLLFWAHNRALRTGSLRSTVLAVELMFLAALTPFGYLLVRTEGLDFWPFIVTLFIVLASFAPLYWYQPRRARERLQSARKDIRLQSGS